MLAFWKVATSFGEGGCSEDPAVASFLGGGPTAAAGGGASCDGDRISSIDL